MRKRKKTMVQDSCIKRTVTLDGIEVSVMANVRSREDVELAMQGGADGIGLFRTEPFFLSAKHFPSDKEFAAFLRTAFARRKGSISTFVFSTLAPTRTRPTSICHRNPIPFWDGVACEYCANIPTYWRRNCGLCWKCLSNSALGF